MTPQEEATRLVVQLLAQGFTQTDVARGLGMTAKGSGSYIGQVLRGRKGGSSVERLRILAGRAAGATVPAGRAGAEQRQQLLGADEPPASPRPAAPKRTPGSTIRKTKKGVPIMQAADARQGIENSGAPNCTRLIMALAAYPTARMSIRIVARYPEGHPAHRSAYFRRFYGVRRRNPRMRKGSSRVLEATFGGAGGRGLVPDTWRSLILAAGSLPAALEEFADVQHGVSAPAAWLRIEVNGWVV
ncbi:hypothetical protein [Streptomyces sp. GZWMJZ-114]|uniref:hypothetical protein n=1 Tax=Streptomyces sp. GZWMJZ-114 TaxID=2494734 RepID=UPI0010138577|nr:hypothetical protein [Streptomyces sp. GZWMJZ-114]